MISERMKFLLIEASKCFAQGFSPFDTEWLSKNEVTLDESISFSELIGIIIKSVALSEEKLQATLFIQYAMNSVDEDELNGIK